MDDNAPLLIGAGVMLSMMFFSAVDPDNAADSAAKKTCEDNAQTINTHFEATGAQQSAICTKIDTAYEIEIQPTQ